LKLDLTKAILLTAFKVSHEILTPWYNQLPKPVKFIVYKITFVNKLGLNKLTISISYFIFEISYLLISIKYFPEAKSLRKTTKKY
jgi:hypothetical protein